MLFRSTGLGKTELVAEIDHIERRGDYLVLHVNTLEPVRWKIRGAISYNDLMTLLKAALKASVIAFLLSPFRAFRQANHPGDF
ncbi:unnamed protein product [marine sediment metagenome]|uniref:Uncharacterized protein n=1 Tax=marine sediment metagenome TaxID=412755 RepID=X0V680_9ZZZZ